jgi:hypothetical protein
MTLAPELKGYAFTEITQVNKVLLSRGALKNEIARDINNTLSLLSNVNDGEETVLRNILSLSRSTQALSIAAFRSTKFIIRLDPDMADMLVRTQVPDKLPSSVFRHLPAWSFYLEIPKSIQAKSGIEDIHGAYVTIAASSGKTSLVVLAISNESTSEPVLHIIREFGDIIDMARFIDPQGTDPKLATEKMIRSDVLIRYVTSVAMYMSSKEPDYESSVRPSNPTAIRSARGMVFPEKKDAITLALGYRIGAAINAASKENTENTSSVTTGRTMPAHLRKAHWHHFWTGQRPDGSGIGNRKLVLHFLPPIPVNLDNNEQLVATVRALETPQIDGLNI